MEKNTEKAQTLDPNAQKLIADLKSIEARVERIEQAEKLPEGISSTSVLRRLDERFDDVEGWVSKAATAVSAIKALPAPPGGNFSTSIKEITTALSKAQAEISAALKDREGHFKNEKGQYHGYATLAACLAVAKEPLAKNNLAVTHVIVRTGPQQLELETVLSHSSGEWIKSTMPLIVQKNDMQGFGSAITYARRYAFSALVGVAQDDDDGEGAGRENARGKAQGKPAQNDAPKNGGKEGPNTIGRPKPKSETADAPAEKPEQPAPASVDPQTERLGALRKLTAAAQKNEYPNELVTKVIAINYEGRNVRDLTLAEINDTIEYVSTVTVKSAMESVEMAARAK